MQRKVSLTLSVSLQGSYRVADGYVEVLPCFCYSDLCCFIYTRKTFLFGFLENTLQQWNIPFYSNQEKKP